MELSEGGCRSGCFSVSSKDREGVTVRRRGELMEYANAEADACVCLAFIEPPLLDDGARTFWRHHT